jgi:hypothetical protein
VSGSPNASRPIPAQKIFPLIGSKASKMDLLKLPSAGPYAPPDQQIEEDFVVVNHPEDECPMQALYRMEPFFRQHLVNWRPGQGRWLILISSWNAEAFIESTCDDDWIIIHKNPKWPSKLGGLSNLDGRIHMSMLTHEPSDQVLTLRFAGTGTSAIDINFGADEVARFSGKNRRRRVV